MKVLAGKILMIVENPYPQDTRVRNEATRLSAAGYKLTIIAKKYPKQVSKEMIDQIQIYRVPWFKVFDKTTESKSKMLTILFNIGTKLGYIIEYIYFTLSAFIYTLFVLLKEGFDVIHIHNPPNTLFLIGLFYRIIGKKFVFDHHDLSPELFLSRYNTHGGLIYNILLLEEKLCLKSANVVIATNESYKAIDIKRGKKRPESIFIVRNGPDLKKFKIVPPEENIRKLGKQIFVYIGEMGPQDGVDYLLKSLAVLINEFNRKDFYCIIIGKGDAVPDLINLKNELNLDAFVKFTGHIPFDELLRKLASADICLDPNPSNPLNDQSTWIKIMEYMSFGKPIVSFDLRETRYSAQNAALYAKPNDIREYAKKIITLMDNPELRKEMGNYGKKRVEEELAWSVVSENLLLAYGVLFNTK